MPTQINVNLATPIAADNRHGFEAGARQLQHGQSRGRVARRSLRSRIDQTAACCKSEATIRRIAKGCQFQRDWAAPVKPLDHCVVGGLVQVEVAVECVARNQRQFALALLIKGNKTHDRLVDRPDDGVGVAVDGGIENGTTVNVAKR